MIGRAQLALDGPVEPAIPGPRESGPGERAAASKENEAEQDRWRVSGLFVQPCEHDDLEEERTR